jgi:hypothetical protein
MTKKQETLMLLEDRKQMRVMKKKRMGVDKAVSASSVLNSESLNLFINFLKSKFIFFTI